jgi:hypothetical protein
MRRFIFHNAFAIVLSVIMPLSFAVAGELTIYSSEGIQTLPSRDSGLSKTPQHNHRSFGNRSWGFGKDVTSEAQKQQNAINAKREQQARDERNAKEAAKETAAAEAKEREKDRQALIEAAKSYPPPDIIVPLLRPRRGRKIGRLR